MIRHPAAVFPALLLAAACGSSSPDAGSDGGREPAAEPSWEGLSVVQSFATRSFGEISQLQWGRFGPHGEPRLAIAGRSVLVADDEGRVTWRAEWNPDDEDGAFMGGLAVGLKLLDPDGDGVDDLIAVSDYGEVHRLSGADGSNRWSASFEQDAAIAQTVLFGEDEAPVVLPAFSAQVLDAATGSARFSLPAKGIPVLGTSARAGGSGSRLLLAVDRASIGANGNDLHVIDGEGAAIHARSSGAFVLGLGAADLDGDGVETMLAGLPEGTLLAFDADGTERFRQGFSLGAAADPAFTYVDAITPVDLDGDGKMEILFALVEYHLPELTHLVAATGAGQELWRVPLGGIASNVRASPGFAAVAIGEQAFGVPGDVAGVELSMEGASVSWRHRSPYFVTDLEIGPDGAVLSAGIDGRVRGYAQADGSPAEVRALGHYSTRAVATFGDKTFVGDGAGEFALYDADGARLWSRPIVLDGIGTSVAALALDDTLVAVGVSPYSGLDPTTVQAFSATGETLFVARHRLDPGAAIIADGKIAVAYGGEIPSSDCVLATHSPSDGAVAWELPLRPCVWLSLAAGDVDGDGKDEIAVTAFSYDYPPYVALVGNDGALRWLRETSEVPMWAAIAPGFVSFGGAMGTDGVVVSLDPRTGEALWSTALPSLPDPDDPRKKLTAHSPEGAVVLTPGGWSAAGVAAVSADGRVFHLGADRGGIRWSRAVESERARISSGYYEAGPLAVAPATADEPTVILATQVTPYLIRTAALALSLEGEVKAAFELEGSIRAVAVGTDASGGRHVSAATSLGVTAFGVTRSR